jgi:hypothetical protein
VYETAAEILPRKKKGVEANTSASVMRHVLAEMRSKAEAGSNNAKWRLKQHNIPNTDRPANGAMVSRVSESSARYASRIDISNATHNTMQLANN